MHTYVKLPTLPLCHTGKGKGRRQWEYLLTFLLAAASLWGLRNTHRELPFQHIAIAIAIAIAIGIAIGIDCGCAKFLIMFAVSNWIFFFTLNT